MVLSITQLTLTGQFQLSFGTQYGSSALLGMCLHFMAEKLKGETNKEATST